MTTSFRFSRCLVLAVGFAGAICSAEESLIPEDPLDRVGPGMADLFLRDGEAPVYEATPNHLHVGFRWQPYPDRPKNSEADIERELGQVGSYR